MRTLNELQAEWHVPRLKERSKKNQRALLTQILGIRKELGLSSITMNTHPLSLEKEILYGDRTDSTPDVTKSETED